jgi:2-C-methyl-D-erythritol 4-phosphate cytidylyltransferase/2-C-methyl-D-erythritol 2,4-cyclodiphosphate synthase
MDSAAPQTRVAVIVVAAGAGTRLGRDQPKAFVELRGVTILERALRTVFDASDPAQVIVVVPAAKVAAARAIVTRAAGVADDYAVVVTGGESRQLSVAAGLAAVADGVEVVLVHDAARALTPPHLFDRVARAVSPGLGIIPVLPVSDTVKRVSADDLVLETIDRSDLVHVQTPQGFARAELEAAYAAAAAEYTDDAALYAATGRAVAVVEGEATAFKITTAWDLRRAETLLGGTDGIRTGVGIDVHGYDETTPLWLGGLYWPDEPGLEGHSDGDAVIHALCDALLSAAGLGDLGARFGAADPRFAGAESAVFLRATLALVHGAGYRVVNVAVQIIANRPKIAPRRSELEGRLTELVGAPVSVGASTSDGLGFTGEGRGLAATATALISRV